MQAMAKKERILEDALIFAVIVALVFAGLYFHDIFVPKPLYLEGIMGTMAGQLDLMVKSMEIFQTTPSLENYLVLKMAVSRAYGITLPAYAAYKKSDPYLSQKWENLSIFLNDLEIELKNELVQGSNQEQSLKGISQRIAILKDPLSQLSEKFRDWSKDIPSEEKSKIFWEQLEECQKSIMALAP